MEEHIIVRDLGVMRAAGTVTICAAGVIFSSEHYWDRD